jgi:hypothetical protein
LFLVKEFVSGLIFGEGLFEIEFFTQDDVLLFEDELNSVVLLEGNKGEPSKFFGTLILD